MATDDRDRESCRKLRALRRPRVRDALLVGALACVVAAVVVAPWARRGWLLLLDWAPGPRGVGPTGREAVPTGPAFVEPARLAHAVFGAAVGWLPIAVALAIATAGAAVLIGSPAPARVAAGVAYAWNPFVFDRIAAGQVSFVAGYALLPWIAYAALHARRARDALLVGAVWSLAALCTLHFFWIGGVLVAAGAPPRVCLWQEIQQACAHLDPVSLPADGNGMYRYRGRVDADAASWRLFLYADSASGGTTIDYAQPRFRAIADEALVVRPARIVTPPVPAMTWHRDGPAR